MSPRRMFRVAGISIVALLAFSLIPTPVEAGTDFGVRAGYYTDAEEPFVGAELLTNLDPENRWFFNPNFEWVFVDSADLYTVNFDFHYDFLGTSPLAVWMGAGPAIIRWDPDFGRDNTDVGVNFVAGLGARDGAVRPYVQGKVTLADDSEASLAVGLRF